MRSAKCERRRKGHGLCLDCAEASDGECYAHAGLSRDESPWERDVYEMLYEEWSGRRQS